MNQNNKPVQLSLNYKEFCPHWAETKPSKLHFCVYVAFVYMPCIQNKLHIVITNPGKCHFVSWDPVILPFVRQGPKNLVNVGKLKTHQCSHLTRT